MDLSKHDVYPRTRKVMEDPLLGCACDPPPPLASASLCLDQTGDISPADDEDAPEQDGGYQHDNDSRQHGQACTHRQPQHMLVNSLHSFAEGNALHMLG